MPIQTRTVGGRTEYRWGNRGRWYAKRGLALRQARAIAASKSQNRRRVSRTWVENVFCPTGEGGGVDPTCSPSKSAGGTKINVSKGINIDAVRLGEVADSYKSEIGLESEVTISIVPVTKQNRGKGGAVGWKDPDSEGRWKIDTNLEIRDDGTLTQPQVEAIVRHEMTHMKQSEDNRFYLKKEQGTMQLFWEGEPHTALKQYTRLINTMTGRAKNPKIKINAAKKYRALPWEAEAHAAGDPFGDPSKVQNEKTRNEETIDEGYLPADVLLPPSELDQVANQFVSREWVENHGEHDQKSHGRRRQSAPSNKQEAVSRFEETLDAVFGGKASSGVNQLIELSGGRQLAVGMDQGFSPDGGREFTVRMDFIIQGGGVSAVGKTLERESIELARTLKTATKEFFDAGFKIKVSPADDRRERLYEKVLGRLGLTKERTEGHVSIWNQLTDNAQSTKRRNPNSVDPTRTGTLRKRFINDFTRRLNALKREIRQLVVDEDAFGLRPENIVSNELTDNTRFRFLTRPQKIDAFKAWLASRLLEDLVSGSVDPAEDEPWWGNRYVEEAYQKGQGRAFDLVRRPALASSMDFFEGTRQEFLRQSFAQPVAVEKVQLVAGRAFDDLKGITEAMSNDLSRVLTEGFIKGESPRDIGRELSKQVDLSKSRATRIARTEVIRAHAEGNLDALEQLGVEDIGVAVEWSTTGDGRVCPKCQPLEGVILKTKEAHGMFPRHPNAVFADSTFISYGECEELVRAWYRGPCVVFTSGRGRTRTTIGPNHPVMTRRGMIIAAELREGDEVLYDRRSELLSVGLDFEQVPTVQNVFESTLSVPHNPGIIASSSDLHGDRTYCQGEVDAVRPAGSLLIVLDSFGVEKFREQGFTTSDPQLHLGAGFGSSHSGLHRIFLSAPSLVSSGGALGTTEYAVHSHLDQTVLDNTTVDPVFVCDELLGVTSQVQLSDFFEWQVIHDVSFSMYEGWAFDATTHTSLYCSGGLVVSNCRCSPIPANLGEDEKQQKRRRGDIRQAIARSIKAEIPKSKRGKRSIETQRRHSTWQGAGKRIDKKRPKSILDG